MWEGEGSGNLWRHNDSKVHCYHFTSLNNNTLCSLCPGGHMLWYDVWVALLFNNHAETIPLCCGIPCYECPSWFQRDLPWCSTLVQDMMQLTGITCMPQDSANPRSCDHEIDLWLVAYKHALCENKLIFLPRASLLAFSTLSSVAEYTMTYFKHKIRCKYWGLTDGNMYSCNFITCNMYKNVLMVLDVKEISFGKNINLEEKTMC